MNEERLIPAWEWWLRVALGRIRCARHWHAWRRTEIGWPYEEHWYCARDWPLPCGATTRDEERAQFGVLGSIRFDLERIPLLRRAFRWYSLSRFAR